MRQFILSTLSIGALLAGVPAQAQQQTSLAPGAILRSLDKLSGRSSDFEVRSGGVAQIGRLRVTLRECRFPSGNRAGEAFAGLEIRETGREDPVFSGWMVASAPALSALDHPHYDVWVIRCTKP